MLSHRRFDRATVITVGLVVFSFLLTTIDVRGSGVGFADTVRDGAHTLFSPVQRLASAVTRPAVGFVEGIADVATLQSENDRLQAEVERLRNQLAETAQLRARLEELEKINDLDLPGEFDTVTARIFAVGPSNFDHIRRIDRGRDDGIVEGMAVVDESGLVGRIVAPVTAHTATVRLITDPLSSVGVRVVSTGETGWVTGRGSGPLLLKMTAATAPIEAGALLVTGGGRFPPDLVVATVRDDVGPDVGFTITTVADPTVDIGRLDFVKVLLTTVGDEPVVDGAEPAEGEGAAGSGGGEATP